MASGPVVWAIGSRGQEKSVGLDLDASCGKVTAMSSKALFVAPLVIFCTAVPVWAQKTVNPSYWNQQEDGLSVASSQQVTTRPTKLRLFTTLTARDKAPRRAVSSLAEKKKSARDKLQALGVKPIAVTFSPIRILEWHRDVEYWTFHRSASPMHVPNQKPSSYTAYAAVQVDWEIKEQTNDELTLMLIDLMDQIRNAAPFGVAHTDQAQSDFDDATHEMFVLFVGEISEEAETDATKRAYDEANAHAAKLAATTNRTLGKLEAMAPRVEGHSLWHWDVEYATSYLAFAGMGGWISTKKSGIPHPMSEFTPSPSEVFGADPAGLRRSYSIELRFELK